MGNVDVIGFVQLYSSKLEVISGFRVLKDEIIGRDSDPPEVKLRKECFRRYLEWFTRERASLYIIKGEATNLREYLQYKNEVLLYYLKRPSEWYSNKPLWKNHNDKPRKKRRAKKVMKKEEL